MTLSASPHRAQRWLVRDIWCSPHDKVGPIEYHFTLPEDEIQATGFLNCFSFRLSTGFVLKGSLEVTLSLSCDRTGEPFQREERWSVEEHYVLDEFESLNGVKAPQSLNSFEAPDSLSDRAHYYEVVSQDDALDLQELCRQLVISNCLPPFFAPEP
jgi:hypothetical protein